METKTLKKTVESVATIQEDLNKLTVDEINKIPDVEPEVQAKTFEQLCKDEGVLYIKPKRRVTPPLGKLHEKQKAAHARDWEYVKGIYENYINSREPIKFFYNGEYGGDPDYEWEVPCNVTVAVPRFIARHLENVQKYHQFGYIEKSSGQYRADDFTNQFAAVGTTYRGKFRALEYFR